VHRPAGRPAGPLPLGALALTGACSATARADVLLLAPPLLWSEAGSALHLAVFRGIIGRSEADEARGVLARTATRRDPPDLLGRAWAIAGRTGWARTYDAGYCALAELEGCLLVTTDGRLRRAAEGRLPYVVGPAEAMARL
jgi:predicted nucleic acid-binding protein